MADKRPADPTKPPTEEKRVVEANRDRIGENDELEIGAQMRIPPAQ